MYRSVRRTCLVGALMVGSACSTSPPTRESLPPWRPAEMLMAANGDEDDHLGAGDALTGVALALSRDGQTLAVSAAQEDGGSRGINGNQADNSAFDAGAVYVFTRSGSGWTEQAYLKASNTQSGDNFGFALALSADGNTLAATANFEDGGAAGINGNQADESADGSGAVYVFTRSGGTWTQVAYIKPSNIEEGDRFGYSVAMSDDGSTMAVGSIGEDSAASGMGGDERDNSAAQAGAVYLFGRAGGTWTQRAYLKASNTQAGDMFGFCVALSATGDTMGVCAYDEDSGAEGVNGDQQDNSSNGSGAAYVFVREAGAWRQEAYVKASNTTLQAAFGASIAISADGNTLAICAVDEDGLSPGVGAAQWQADRKVTDRTRVAEASAGAIYVFERANGNWSQQAYIKSSNIRANDTFGVRLAMSADGNVVAAGAPLQPGGGAGVNPSVEDDSSPESGAAYVFTRDSGQWRQDAYLKAPNAAEYAQFGSGVGLSGDGLTLASAAQMAEGGAAGTVRDAGLVYLFTRAEVR